MSENRDEHRDRDHDHHGGKYPSDGSEGLGLEEYVESSPPNREHAQPAPGTEKEHGGEGSATETGDSRK